MAPKGKAVPSIEVLGDNIYEHRPDGGADHYAKGTPLDELPEGVLARVRANPALVVVVGGDDE